MAASESGFDTRRWLSRDDERGNHEVIFLWDREPQFGPLFRGDGWSAAFREPESEALAIGPDLRRDFNVPSLPGKGECIEFVTTEVSRKRAPVPVVKG